MDISDSQPENYSSATPREIVERLTYTVNELHRIGTTNTLLTDSDKAVMQFSHDVLAATRNGLLDSLPKDDSPASVIVTATKGDTVRAATGLRFRK